MLDDNDKVHALESGIITLTGGRSATKNLILSISTNKLEELSEWSTAKLASLILHLVAISKYLQSQKDDISASSQNLPLACLADLRHASTLAIKQLTESLESVEHQQRGTISTVYFLKPRNKQRSRTLKKLLGVMPSKKRPRVPLFKVILMKSVQELHTNIDVSQLTADFCGILRYNHQSWMHLYNVVIKCVEGCHDLLAKSSSVRDKVDLLQEYETDGQTSSQVQQLLADLIEKFHIILSESSLPLFLTMSKQTLFLLDNPSSDNHLSAVNPMLISGLRSYLHGVYSELDQLNTDLEEAWRVTESRLTVLIQIHRHRERAKEIERKICEYYHPLLREHPIVGKTLSQAELYRAHFTTTLYDPAKELLSQATEILEAVQRLKTDVASRPKFSAGRQDSTNTYSNTVIRDQDISDISKCLTTSIQPFATQLQQFQQVYVSIHIFHLLFEKALIWYKKVLKFIPESLLQRCTTESGLSVPVLNNIPLHVREFLVYMPSEWLGAVRVFLSRHPPPRQEHIDRIDESIPQLVDRKMRSQARSLALRLRLLHRILTSTRLPLKVITAILAWRAELFGPVQQEKASGIHHAAAPAKDVANVGLSINPENHNLASKSSSRTHINRAPEKPPRSKKSILDREARPRSGISQFAASTGGISTEELRVVEKPSLRHNSSKIMQRSKSVDFNFNSSSTDGSVFDYEKALVQVETNTDAARMKSTPRKSRSSLKEVKLLSTRADDLKTRWTDESTFSEATESLNIESRSYGSETKPDNLLQDNPRSCSSEPGSVKSKYGILGHNFGPIKSVSERDAIPEPEPDSIASSSHMILPQQTQQLRQEKEKPVLLDHNAVTPNSNERFIRVTFTPKQLSVDPRPAFRFSNEDLQSYTVIDEDETGIDLTQLKDPYDGVVNSIREISASNLSNIDKLKKVSELLSLNTLEGGPSQRNLKSNKTPSKISASTMDLRATYQDANKKYIDFKNDSNSLNQNQNQTEKPVEAVLRMKKNLAKSMEELNISTSYSQQSIDNTIGQNSDTVSVSYDNKKSYQSKPKTQPRYKKISKVFEETVVNQVHSHSHSAPENEAPKHLTLSRDQDSSLSQRWSDVESYSHGISPSLSSQDPRSRQVPSSFLDSTSNRADSNFSRTIISRFIPENTPTDRYPVDTVAQTEDRMLSMLRPASLNLFSSRNFISPSFLRPASSMGDLSTEGQPEIIFDGDFEQDYQALEDLEILRTIQEDHLSKGFQKYTSKTPRKHSGDYTVEKVTDEKRRGESSHRVQNPYQSLMSEMKGFQYVTRHETKSVPEVRVNHLTEDWSSFDDRAEVGFSYLHALDVNFDRLTIEADKEYLSQEDVAESLRKTQIILEEEETRRFQRIHPLSDRSLDEEEADDLLGAAGGQSHTTSVDNGYCSWPSKLIHSTSSDRDWSKLSTSSADSSTKLFMSTKANKARHVVDDDFEASDTVHELPQIEKPLTGPDLY